MEHFNGLDSKNAVWTSAVCDDFLVMRQLGQVPLKFFKGDGQGSGNVAGIVFLYRSDIQNGYRSFSELLEDAQKNGLINLKINSRSGTYVVTSFGTAG